MCRQSCIIDNYYHRILNRFSARPVNVINLKFYDSISSEDIQDGC